MNDPEQAVPMNDPCRDPESVDMQLTGTHAIVKANSGLPGGGETFGATHGGRKSRESHVCVWLCVCHAHTKFSLNNAHTHTHSAQIQTQFVSSVCCKGYFYLFIVLTTFAIASVHLSFQASGLFVCLACLCALLDV